MDRPFPLLRLPRLVIQEVLVFLDIFQLFQISLISKTGVKIVKMGRIHTKMTMKITGYITVHFPNSKCYAFNVRGQETDADCYDGVMNGHKIKYSRNKEKYWDIQTYWKDEKTGKVELVKFVTELFNFPRLAFVKSYENPLNRPVIDWIHQKFKGKVDEWVINLPERTQDDIDFMADRCRIARKIDIHSNDETPNRCNFNFDTNELVFFWTMWLTLDDLIQLSMQSIRLEFCSTSLTNEHLNQFLKYWIDSEHEMKMKAILMVSLGTKEYGIDEILHGIDYETEHNLSTSLFEDFHRYTGYMRTSGFSFKRTNGTTAFLMLNPITGTFKIVF